MFLIRELNEQMCIVKCGPFENIDRYYRVDDPRDSINKITEDLCKNTNKVFKLSVSSSIAVETFAKEPHASIWHGSGIPYFLDPALWLVAHFTQVCIWLIRLFPTLPWDWGVISRSPFVTAEFIEQNISLLWEWRYYVSLNPNITSDFIAQYGENLDPRYRTRNTCNPQDYFNEEGLAPEIPSTIVDLTRALLSADADRIQKTVDRLKH